MSENTKEETNNNNSESQNELIKSIIELLKESKLNEIVDSMNNVRIEKIKSDEKVKLESLKNENINITNNINFWNRKFVKESIVLFILLCFITFLSVNCKIDNCTLGTLIGSIIGYTIGNFSLNNKNN